MKGFIGMIIKEIKETPNCKWAPPPPRRIIKCDKNMSQKKCPHNSINWKFSQFSPDCGVCWHCKKLVYAESPSSAVHDEDEPEYREKIMEIIRKI